MLVKRAPVCLPIWDIDFGIFVPPHASVHDSVRPTAVLCRVYSQLYTVKHDLLSITRFHCQRTCNVAQYECTNETDIYRQLKYVCTCICHIYMPQFTTYSQKPAPHFACWNALHYCRARLLYKEYKLKLTNSLISGDTHMISIFL